MSVAVRVSVWILGVLVVISAGLAVMTLMQKQELQGQNQRLHNELATDESRLADLTTKAKGLEDEKDKLNRRIEQAMQDKVQMQGQIDETKRKSDELQSQLEQANTDRDDWKNRVDTITRERDSLMQKLRNQPVKIVYKDRIIKVPAARSSAPSLGSPDIGNLTASSSDVTTKQGEQYWANVLKQKAALQVQIEKEKADLDQAALQVVDLKKQKADLEVEVKQLVTDKDAIVRKIKYGQDLADNLSIDLARARNDQQAANDRADKLKEENGQLLNQIRALNSAKLELEKSVQHLTDNKNQMQKKLVETETVNQNRIDDIWKIKTSLDKKLSENASQSGGMELPPIIVNSSNGRQPAAAQQAMPSAGASGKTEGSIISINEPNNFVILDLGQENSAVSVGNPLKVYRDSNVIATLEVIQVRRDISAADIKEKSSSLKVGDVVRII